MEDETFTHITREELEIVAKMLNWYMQRYLFDLRDEEVDAGWKFLDCYLPECQAKNNQVNHTAIAPQI